MTMDKKLKARIRERMNKTGESYTAARAHVLAESTPTPAKPTGIRFSAGVDAPTTAGPVSAKDPFASTGSAEERAWGFRERIVPNPNRFAFESDRIRIFAADVGVDLMAVKMTMGGYAIASPTSSDLRPKVPGASTLEELKRRFPRGTSEELNVSPAGQARTFLNHMRDTSSIWIQERTVTLLVEEPIGEVSQYGTGILLAIADQVFLISAAHVLKAARNRPLWVNPVATGARLIPLEGVEINLTNDEHQVDFGFVVLPESTRAELANHKKFVRLSEIDLEPMSLEGWYAAFGYPAEINVRNSTTGTVPTTGVFYGTRLHDWSKEPRLASFDPALNIALEFAPERSSDSSGALAPVPHPGGMSGCGLWRLYRVDSNPARWSIDDVRLTGIQHTQVKHGSSAVLLGIRFSHVLWALRRAFPTLRAAIDLHLPSARLPLVVTRDAL